MRKEQQQPPPRINFAEVWSEHILKIKTKIQKVVNLIIQDSDRVNGPSHAAGKDFTSTEETIVGRRWDECLSNFLIMVTVVPTTRRDCSSRHSFA